MTMVYGEMVHRLLHDARALLRRPFSAAQLLERRIHDASDPEIKPLLDSVLAGHRDLDRFFTRVGMLADAIEPNDQPPLPLSTVVLAVRLVSKADLTAAGAQLDAGPLPACQVPPNLQIALQELLNNSLRFRAADRSPRLSLQCRVENGKLTLEHSDNGAGWDTSYTDRIFRPFERLDVQRGGFGLGLAIAQAIVDCAGGNIRATTNPSGSRFVIELPVPVEA